MEAEFGLGLQFVEANAEETRLPDASFDLALSEYGASIWCDPYKWIPEAARLLRPGGLLVFLRNSTLAVLCADRRRRSGRRRCSVRSAGCTGSCGPSRHEIEFQLGHGDWIRLLRANGFEIERARTSSTRAEDAVDHDYYHSNAEWSKKWPSEEIWRARLRPR